MNKVVIRRHIANDELRDAIDALLRLSEQYGLEELYADALVQSNRYQEWERERNLGGRSFEELSQQKVQISRALVELSAFLPDDASASAAKRPVRRPGMPEERFKGWFFALLIVLKSGLLYWVIFHWQTGGFTEDQAYATMTLLTPTFFVYLSVMFNDVIRRRNELGLTPARYVNRIFTRAAWGLLAVYFVAQWQIISMQAAGSISFKGMNLAMAAAEGGLGVLISQIIIDLFKSHRTPVLTN